MNELFTVWERLEDGRVLELWATSDGAEALVYLQTLVYNNERQGSKREHWVKWGKTNSTDLSKS